MPLKVLSMVSSFPLQCLNHETEVPESEHNSSLFAHPSNIPRIGSEYASCLLSVLKNLPHKDDEILLLAIHRFRQERRFPLEECPHGIHSSHSKLNRSKMQAQQSLKPLRVCEVCPRALHSVVRAFMHNCCAEFSLSNHMYDTHVKLQCRVMGEV